MKTILKFLKGTWIKLIALKHFSSFTIKDGSSFRVTSFYYIYTFANGERKFIPVPWIFANSIGGYGVCGWYIPFREVKSIRYKFNKARWFFYKNEHERNELSTLWMYLFEKQGKPRDYFFDKAMKKAFREIRKKK